MLHCSRAYAQVTKKKRSYSTSITRNQQQQQQSIQTTSTMHYFQYNILSTITVFSVAFLLTQFPTTLLAIAIITTILGNTHFFLTKHEKSTQAKLQLIKVNAVVTCGLIPVVTASLMMKTEKGIVIPSNHFTQYINIAVIGNILMMIFVDTGRFLRGITCRLVCIALVIWLFHEMQAKNWQTVEYDNGYFIFTASPLSWIACHAIYRTILITLPSFETRRYLLLECASISCMYLLWYLYHASTSTSPTKTRHVSEFFGMADTITIASLSLLFGFVDFIQITGDGCLNYCSSLLFDCCCVVVHVGILLFIGRFIIVGAH
jgi:hypothetical protein